MTEEPQDFEYLYDYACFYYRQRALEVIKERCGSGKEFVVSIYEDNTGAVTVWFLKVRELE